MILNKKRPGIFTFLSLLFLFLTLIASGQSGIPVRPEPPRLVNDFAGFLSTGERNQLEQKLVNFGDTTSTQIAIVILKSLNGYEPNDMATRIMETWGIGQKKTNNGLLILVKPKTAEERGQVFITGGYGVEEFVTDGLSKRIVEKDMLPLFRTGQYYQGLDQAVNTLMSLVKGQFTANQYMAKKKSKEHLPVAAIIIIVILAFVFFFGRSNNGPRSYSSGGGSIPFWMLMGGMMGGGRSGGGGGFGDFNSGGGDFGGFGGGSGGGGGAGGSW